MNRKIKITVGYSIAIILLSIPLLICAIFYYSDDNKNISKLPLDDYSLNIIKPDGTVVELGTDEGDMALILRNAVNKLKKVSSSTLSNYDPEKFINFTLTYKNKIYNYDCFVSDNLKDVFFRDKNNTFYTLKDDKSKTAISAFLTSPYTNTLFAYSSAPVLTLSERDTIIPKSVKWYYASYSPNSNYYVTDTDNVENTTVSSQMNEPYTERNFTALNNIKLSSNTIKYLIYDKIKFEFDIQPDCFNIVIYELAEKTMTKIGEPVFQGTYEEYLSTVIDDSKPMEYIITANWEKSRDKNYYGIIEYDFITDIPAAPEFRLDQNSVAVGEYVLLIGKNIPNTAEIKISENTTSYLEELNSLGFNIIFYRNGNEVFAFIPIDQNVNAPCTFKFSLSYMKYSTELELHIIRSENLIPSIFTGAQGKETEKNMAAFISAHCLENNTIYFSDKFWANRITESNTAVKALNCGIVVYSGTDDSLSQFGKFIVIDHGYGVKTWYCNLKQTLTSVGMITAKDEIVGTVGEIASGQTYCFTTISNIPVVSVLPLKDIFNK